MNFFLDVFNKLLKINDEEIIVIFDIHGDIWFSMRNIFNILGYNNIDKAINKIKIDAIYKKYYKNIRVCPA